MAPAGFGEVAERLRRSTVQIECGSRRPGGGSGVIWRPDGLVVTNAHVAAGPQATVQLWDGSRVPATVTAADPQRDLAALKLEARELPAATIGDSDRLRVGELVLAVGNPLGFIGALSAGVVHAIGPLPGVSARTWVQADVRLAPGNSGGPLADASGRVIGINTMVAGGLGLAVPSNAVTDFLRRGASGPRLGVTVRPVPLRSTAGASLGLLVLDVEPGGAAAAASLQCGDILIGAGGRPFRAIDGLSAALENGGAVPIEFLRDGKPAAREVTVRLNTGEREAA